MQDGIGAEGLFKKEIEGKVLMVRRQPLVMLGCVVIFMNSARGLLTEENITENNARQQYVFAINHDSARRLAPLPDNRIAGLTGQSLKPQAIRCRWNTYALFLRVMGAVHNTVLKKNFI